MANETSPLLSGKDTTYKTRDSNSSDDRITILTSNPASAASSIKSGAVPTTEDDIDEIVKERLNGASFLTVLVGLWIGVILSSLDSSIVATIYPQIGTEFKRSNEIIWIATSYMLSYTALQPLYGRISDVFGRKSAMLFASIIFFIGSFLCGAATNLWALVVARAIAGVGGGGINTMTTVIYSDLVPLRERGKYQGYANIAYAFGSVVGAPLGGFITDNFGWRYCFYINLPFLIVTIYVSSCVLTNYNLDKDSGESFSERLKKIDYAGAATVVTAVVAFLFATSMGGNILPWSDPLVVGCLVGSVILAIMFCFIEAKFALNPLMPWNIVSSRTPFACCMTNLCCLMSTTAVIYTTPLFFQGLLGYSSSKAGLYFLPKIGATSVGSVLSGIYMSRTGEYRTLTIASACSLFTAMVGYCTWTPTTSNAFMLVCLLMDGFAFGAIITLTLVAMLSCVGSSEMATITSMSYLFRSVGGVIGISATSAIFQGSVKRILTEKITGENAEMYIEIARKSMNEIRELLPADILEIVLDAYQTGLRYTFFSCAVIGFLCVISTLYIQRFELATKVTRK